MFKSQASLKSLPSSLKQVSGHSANKSSPVNNQQVKSSPDKGQVKSQYQIGTNISLPHDLIIFPQKLTLIIRLK